jgi:ABC-type sugar transport system substrate-binding protein
MRFMLLTLLTIFTLVLANCTGAAPAEAPVQAPAAEEAATEEAVAEEPAAAADETLTIALSLPDMAFPFFVFMESQVRAEAEALGNVEIVTLDGQNQVPKQTADLEAAIAQEYDGILISPLTADAMAPAVQQAVDAGIPVVTIDRSVTGVNTLAHAGADNVLGGEQQGQALLELFPDGAVIFELEGEPGSSPAIDRSQGLHNVIDGVANIEVACKQTANFRRDRGLSVTESCLGATPEPDAIVAANDEMAFGAIEAVKAAGLTDVVVIGYDALPEALQLVQSGELYGTVEQFPGDQSQVALRTLVDFLRSGAEPAGHDIYIAPKMITQDNIDEAERIGEIQ